jgi:hypothetical protein
LIFITRRHLSRRALLKGVGVAIALPFLDAMHPALSAERSTDAAPARRLLVVEYPHGVVDDTWNPIGEGLKFCMSQSLEPLEHHRSKLTIIRGFTSSPDRARGDFHDRAVSSFLTGCERNRSPGSPPVPVGVSVDQLAAKVLGARTRIASLELGIESAGLLGGPCYSDAFTNLPMECNPRVAFERLFGDSGTTDPVVQAARMADDLSILDVIGERITAVNRQLGAPDRRKLDQYLGTIRDMERRIRIASDGGASLGLPRAPRPAGIPDNWLEHVHIMFDLQVLALQADLTRVITFATARETSGMTFPHLGISMEFHEISHHNNSKVKLDALSKVNRNHSELFAYYLDKLDAVREPAGSLLDQSLILYGSDLSNASVHSQRDLPIIVAGGAAGGVKGGRYIRVTGHDDGPPLTNLHLALLDKVGAPTEKMGDSTEVFGGLES